MGVLRETPRPATRGVRCPGHEQQRRDPRVPDHPPSQDHAERAGLPTFGRHRRVSGLRREEVALVAGSASSTTRGSNAVTRRVSDEVLHAVSGALQLDDAERAHLLDLVRAANDERLRDAAPPRSESAPASRASSMRCPALPRSSRTDAADIVYANALATAIYPTCTGTPFARRTRRASCSSIREQDVLRRLGEGRQRDRRRPSRRGWAQPIDRALSDLSGCCPRAATSSASAGQAMTFASTAPARSASTTLLSVT